MNRLRPLLVLAALVAVAALLSGCGHHGGNLITHTLI